MAIKAVLFDLDGTLLPMDQDRFVKSYLSRISAALAVHGYHPKLLVSTIWAGTEAMVKNDGSRNNETVFWDGLLHSSATHPETICRCLTSSTAPASLPCRNPAVLRPVPEKYWIG